MAIVLYVEDDPETLDSAILVLNVSGHTVRGANDGQKALEVLTQENNIDIIFVDYRMPVMNGYDFSKAVRTDPRYRKYSKIPVVGVGDFPSDRREYLVECLPKPRKPQELLRCIAQYC